jgi:dTDP-4-amino-4,6-dideoxygalactose transaminase
VLVLIIEPSIHQFSYHCQLVPNVSLPQTERVAEREVTLPLYSSMSDSQVGLVQSAVKGALEGARAG